MQIIVADPCGFCYGVKRAIDIAQMNVKGYNTSIATLGEIVHNPRVVESLAPKRCTMQGNTGRFFRW